MPLSRPCPLALLGKSSHTNILVNIHPPFFELGERVHSTYAAMGGGGVWPLRTRLYKRGGGSDPCVCTQITNQIS